MELLCSALLIWLALDVQCDGKIVIARWIMGGWRGGWIAYVCNEERIRNGESGEVMGMG
jgi:hypothetical protein